MMELKPCRPPANCGRTSTINLASSPVSDSDTLLDINAALNRLAEEDAASADVARFRLFARLRIDEAAEALGLSRATPFREMAHAGSRLTTAPLQARGTGCSEVRVE